MAKQNIVLTVKGETMEVVSSDPTWVPIVERLYQSVQQLESLQLVHDMCLMAVEELEEKKEHTHRIARYLDTLTTAKKAAKALADEMGHFNVTVNDTLRSYIAFGLLAATLECMSREAYEESLQWSNWALDYCNPGNRGIAGEDLYKKAIELHDEATTHVSKRQGYGYGLYIILVILIVVFWLLFSQFGLLEFIKMKLHMH